jgi:hypothetical protein
MELVEPEFGIQMLIRTMGMCLQRCGYTPQ